MPVTAPVIAARIAMSYAPNTPRGSMAYTTPPANMLSTGRKRLRIIAHGGLPTAPFSLSDDS